MANKSKSNSKQNSSSSGVGVNSGMGINYGVNQSGQQSNNQSSSSGGSFNSSESSQDVWAGQSPHLVDVYNAGGDAYGQAQQGISGLQPGVSADMANAQQQAMGGFGSQMGGGFASGLQGQVGPNSYVNALKGDMMNDANLIKQQNLGGLDARAAASGMSGSTGYHSAANKMANNIDRSTLQGMNNLGFQAHNQGVQNQMNLANMMDRNQQFGVGQTGAMQQAAMNQFNPHMMGLNAAGQYANIIGGPTVLGQSSSSGGSSQSSQSSGSSSGFSNGMNVGLNTNQGTNINNSTGHGTSSGSSWGVEYPGA